MVEKIWFLEHLPDHPIFLFGAGARGAYTLDQLVKRGFNVAGFIDTYKTGMFQGLPISSLESFLDARKPNDVVVIASQFAAQIADRLEALAVPEVYDASACYETPRRWDDTPQYVMTGMARDHTGLDRIHETLTKGSSQPTGFTDYVVNIGCNDGKTLDPCYPLFQKGLPGLAVDYFDLPDLYENIPGHHVIKATNVFVTPQSITRILEIAQVPHTPFVLKIDIDSTDGQVLQRILESGYRPAVIQMEVNNDFPPPFKFAVLHHPIVKTKALSGENYSAGLFGFYGCSLSFIADVGRRYGYELYAVNLADFRDAILVRSDLKSALPGWPDKDERQLFLDQAKGFSHVEAECGIDTQHWRDREDYPELFGEIWNACLTMSQARYGCVMPFTLTY